MAKKTNKEIALEVMANKWGSGDTRKSKLKKAGYNYDKVQAKVTELANNKAKAVKSMNAWATKIANDNSFHYKKFRSDVAESKECPICKEYPKDKETTDPKKAILGNHGWNCIGLAFAIWHHGGKLPCACNCHVIADDIAQKIMDAKTDAEALKIAKKYIKLDNITIIRGKNNKNIAKSKWQAGDICFQFSGVKFTHVFYFRGDGKITDSSGSNGKVAVNNQIATRDYSGYSARFIIRYLGDFDKETEKKSETNAKIEESKKEEPKKIKVKYPGKLPTTILKKTNAQAIQDAVKWAKWIANDNSFHYGYTNKKVTPWNPNAHHNGCYFCGTNGSKKGMLDYKKTYCCNPFVGAAWAHGACDTKALSLCSHHGSWGFGTGVGSYHQSDRFKRLGHPKMSKLQAGDVLCMDTHIALYVGNGKIAEAGCGDDNVRNSTKWNNSIRVRTLTASNYKKFKRAYRYIGSVNTTINIKHGEVSDRVKLWQNFLDWYYDGKVGAADGYFGDNTLKWTKKFQKEVGLNGTGSVGSKTLVCAAKVDKEIVNA